MQALRTYSLTATVLFSLLLGISCVASFSESAKEATSVEFEEALVHQQACAQRSPRENSTNVNALTVRTGPMRPYVLVAGPGSWSSEQAGRNGIGRPLTL